MNKFERVYPAVRHVAEELDIGLLETASKMAAGAEKTGDKDLAQDLRDFKTRLMRAWSWGHNVPLGPRAMGRVLGVFKGSIFNLASIEIKKGPRIILFFKCSITKPRKFIKTDRLTILLFVRSEIDGRPVFFRPHLAAS